MIHSLLPTLLKIKGRSKVIKGRKKKKKKGADEMSNSNWNKSIICIPET